MKKATILLLLTGLLAASCAVSVQPSADPAPSIREALQPPSAQPEDNPPEAVRKPRKTPAEAADASYFEREAQEISLQTARREELLAKAAAAAIAAASETPAPTEPEGTSLPPTATVASAPSPSAPPAAPQPEAEPVPAEEPEPSEEPEPAPQPDPAEEPAPAEEPDPEPEEPFVPYRIGSLGNTGMEFATESEAEDWAWDYLSTHPEYRGFILISVTYVVGPNNQQQWDYAWTVDLYKD